MNPATRNFVFGSALIIGVGVFAFWPNNTNCNEPVGKIVFIIDQTESISRETRDSVKGYAIKLIEQAQENTSISVRYLLADGLKSQKLTFCRPKKLSATTAVNNDEDEVKKIWITFQENFNKALDEQLPTQSASPIYRSLINAAREEFIGINENKTIVLFSDLKDYIPGRSNIHDSCNNPAVSSKDIVSSLPIGKMDKPLDGITTIRYMIPRTKMSKETIRCLVEVSDRITNELSGSKTDQLSSVVFLPESP
jgi:hypothetical protein